MKDRLKTWPLILFAVLSILIVSVVGTLITLYFLSATPTGERFRASLGLDQLKTFTVQSNRVERIVVEESSAIIEASKAVSPSVVSITSGRLVRGFFGLQTAETSGTGFIVTSDGLIATNKHVVEGGSKFTITTSDGKSYEGEVVATDPVTDLALIKIPARGLPVVEFGDSDKVEVGQWVIAIGNALGEFQNSVTVGVISAKDRTANPSDATGKATSLDGLLQTDAAINSGNSGGPLLALTGQVIGINTAIVGGAQNIGFAIPSNDLRQALDSFQKHNKIIRPFIGVEYHTLTRVIARELNLSTEQGALLFGGDNTNPIRPNSPAERAGLRSGDIITKINDNAVTQTTPLARIIRKYNPGDRITLTVIRDKAEIKIELTLGSLGN